MKFLVDAHLPPGLCALLLEAGHDGSRDLKALFKKNLASIVLALEQNSIVELDREVVRIVA